MSTEENKALVRRFFEEMWGKGNLAIADELLTTDFVFHPAPPGVAPDLEGYKQWVRMTCAGLADRQSTVGPDRRRGQGGVPLDLSRHTQR